LFGTGSPEGVTTASPGSIFQRTNSTGGLSFYYKALGAGNTGWVPLNGGYQTIATDAAFTLTPVTSPLKTRHTGTLTADRAVTLATGNAQAGDTFRISRTGGGAFALNVGTGPLKALATNEWCVVEFDGTAWYLAEFGSL
jgi:hypothetical protein